MSNPYPYVTPKRHKAYNNMLNKGKLSGNLKSIISSNNPRAKKVVVSLAPLKCLEKDPNL